MYCMKKLWKNCKLFVKRLDFFAMPASERITFKKNQGYSTLIGQTTSWLIVGITIAAFISFGNDMLFRKNPLSIFSQIVTPDPENLNLNNISFFMSFGLQNLSNFSKHFIDESVYTLEVVQRKKINGVITLESLPIGKCDISKVPENNDLRDYFGRNQIDNLYCIFPNNSSPGPELKSTWDGVYYKNILINVYPCVNSSKNNNKCKSADFIQQSLNSANFAMYFTTNAIDPSNFGNPIESYGKQIYTPISSSTLTYIEMLFGHFDFVTDQGFLFTDSRKITSATFLDNRQILSFRSDIVVQIDMKLDKIKNIYSRSYQKIQNVLASIGGIIKALMIMSSLIVKPFIRLNFRLNLANTIFNFKTDEDNSKIILKKREKKNIKNKKKQKNSKNFENITENHNNNRPNLLSRSDTSKISLSYCGYLMSFFKKCSISNTKKLLNKGLLQIDEVLDISYIMKKLVEIDILKLLLLNDDQINLFECIPKPTISINDDSNNDKKKEKENLYMKFSRKFQRNLSQKEQEAALSFQMMLSKSNKNEIDQKLIKMINKDAGPRKRLPTRFNPNFQVGVDFRNSIKLNPCGFQERSIIIFDEAEEEKKDENEINLDEIKIEENQWRKKNEIELEMKDLNEEFMKTT